MFRMPICGRPLTLKAGGANGAENNDYNSITEHHEDALAAFPERGPRWVALCSPAHCTRRARWLSLVWLYQYLQRALVSASPAAYLAPGEQRHAARAKSEGHRLPPLVALNLKLKY